MLRVARDSATPVELTTRQTYSPLSWSTTLNKSNDMKPNRKRQLAREPSSIKFILAGINNKDFYTFGSLISLINGFQGQLLTRF